MCFTPQRRAIFWHQTSEKWSVPLSFSTFWLTNMLRATAACHFWTSQLPKWLRRWGVFYIFTYKYASRHSRVAFWNIGTSKMAPALRCFLHFDLQICFSPQRRGILEHWNFQNVSDAEVFSTIWRANVLFATAACHFSPVRETATSAPAALAKLLFEHQEPRLIEKNTAIRDVTNICRACWTPCYWLYTHVDLLATDMTAVRLCFSTLHIVGS